MLGSLELGREVSAHQQRWLSDSIEIRPEEIRRRSVMREFGDNLLTMVVPLFDAPRRAPGDRMAL